MRRRWADICLAISLVVMVASGLGLFAWHDVPHQVQAATGAFLGIPYEAWSHVHIVASIAFSTAAASHLGLNWLPLVRNFRGGPAAATARRGDMLPAD